MLETELQAMRESRQEIVSALGATFKGDRCNCPFHADKHPSAGIYRTNGAWRFTCHVCKFTGDVFDVLAKKDGSKLSDFKRKPEKIYPSIAEIERNLPNHEATYRYTNPETNELDLLVFRYRRTGEERKAFAQGRQVENGFTLSAPKGKLPIYNRTRVRDAAEVLVVEGEKCVHALHAIGITATTNPGGAGKSSLADWSPLKGKTVYLWADNDEVGARHMQEIATLLEPIAEVRRVDVSSLELPPKGDVVDYLERNSGGPEDKRIAVQLVLDDATEANASKDVETRLEDIISGKWRAIDFPWPVMSRLSKALLPGTITALPGDAGSSKSFMLLEAMWYWHVQGLKTAHDRAALHA